MWGNQDNGEVVTEAATTPAQHRRYATWAGKNTTKVSVQESGTGGPGKAPGLHTGS